MDDIPEPLFTPKQLDRLFKITGPPRLISIGEALSEYKARLPWWRRIFWPRLSELEEKQALLNYVLEHDDRQN